MLSDKVKEDIKRVLNNYANKRSACMAALQIIQGVKGHLTDEDMRELAQLLEVNNVRIQEVGAFYSMYNVAHPVGKHHIQVCANLPCSLLGAEHLVNFIERMLGIKVNGTTPDKKFTLSTVECLGSCATAPMMQINDTYYENLTEEKVRDILNSLKK